MNERWKPGDQIVLRELWQGRVWSGTPVTVVRDEPGLLGMFVPIGTGWKGPAALKGGPLRLPKEDWVLVDDYLPHNGLGIALPGADFSVRLNWTEGFRQLTRWKINLEEPLRRTPQGFDFMDQVLDIVISPDRSEWRWKDEDELEQAQELGLISHKRAVELRAEGERAVELIQSRKPPFDRDWENWRPDRSWPIPELPDRWDVVA